MSPVEMITRSSLCAVFLAVSAGCAVVEDMGVSLGPEPVSEVADHEPTLSQEHQELAVEPTPAAANADTDAVQETGSELNVEETIAAVEGDTTPAPTRVRQIMSNEQSHGVDYLCQEIGNKLGSVSVQDCRDRQLNHGGAVSVKERPLVIRDYNHQNSVEEPSRILIMGGIHGDEYSSISIMFKWMDLLEQRLQFDGEDPFFWRFIPLANPDGLLEGQAVRQNANGVDLNRNFPSTDWARLALKDWRERTGSNPRRFPGNDPASEPEVQWLLQQIREFQPSVIIAVHAPHQLVDFDGPAVAPRKIGELYLHQLGVYPGSLGNYAGIDMGIPVVTLELPSAGIMPPGEQILEMWEDLLAWLRANAVDSLGEQSVSRSDR